MYLAVCDQICQRGSYTRTISIHTLLKRSVMIALIIMCCGSTFYPILTILDRKQDKMCYHSTTVLTVPPFNSYINKQTVLVCMDANSSSACLFCGCFLRHITSTSAQIVFSWLCWLSHLAVNFHMTG